MSVSFFELGTVVEFTCLARRMRGVLVYHAPDAGDDAVTVRVRRVDAGGDISASGWCSLAEHDRYWLIPHQVTAIPTRFLVRTVEAFREGRWKMTGRADIWVSVDQAEKLDFGHYLHAVSP